MEIRTVAVIGAGQMGNGIAHVMALAGYDVLLNDISAEALDKATATIRRNLERQASRGKITEEEAEAALGRITTTQDLTALGKADLIIEMTKDGYAPRKITMDVDLDSNPMFKQMKAQLEAMGMKGLKTTMTFSDVKVNTGLKADAFGFTPYLQEGARWRTAMLGGAGDGAAAVPEAWRRHKWSNE